MPLSMTNLGIDYKFSDLKKKDFTDDNLEHRDVFLKTKTWILN